MTPALRGRLVDAGGEALVERLVHLEASFGQGVPATPAPSRPEVGDPVDCDVLLAGGGLSVLLAPVLADLGLSVVVADRARIGVGHREWNASGPELAPLVSTGLFTAEGLEDLVVARYDEGVCRWHGGGTWPVTGVLDHAIDAGSLLSGVRQAAEARGVRLLDHHTVGREASGPDSVRVQLTPRAGRPFTLTARVFVDARGASSPHAAPDLVCPTVGGVVEGLDVGTGPTEVNPRVGDVLATIDDVTDTLDGRPRQPIWEAFPGRPGQTTVYLFYYARAEELGAGGLTRLYERFFEDLPRYKTGDARLVRPTFGYIPGWSRLRPQPPSPSPRVVLFGDAAGRHSPLTWCGFGHMLRTFEPAAHAIAARVDGDFENDPAGDAPVHRVTGALSALMANPPRGAAMNRLLDAAFGALHTLGNDPYAALLRDELEGPALVDFLRTTARRAPRVYLDTFTRVGPVDTLRWAREVARMAAA